MKYSTRLAVFAFGLVTSNCDDKRPDFAKAANQTTNTSSGTDSGSFGADAGIDGAHNSNASGAASTGKSASGSTADGTNGIGGSDTQATGTGTGTGTAATGTGTGPQGSDGTKDGGGTSPGRDETTSAGNGTTTSSVNPGTQLAELGEACDAASECESGFCADDVCCDSACNEICARCDLDDEPGTCGAAERDADCGELDCSEDTECRSFELASENNCSGIGECAVEANCDSVDTDSGEPCQDGAGTCNGSGECVVPNKVSLGGSCTDDSECGSGFCEDADEGSQVCCNTACDDVCEICGDDGFCTVAADDDDCDPITCSADTSCADYPAPLTANRCAGAGQCVQENAHCTADFASATTSCGSGKFCDGAGACDDACSSPETWCTDACFNLSNDDENCGTCGKVCPTGTSCVSSSCECDGSNEELCEDGCFNLDTDVLNCGSCGNECPEPSEEGSSVACDEGTCGGCGAYGQSCCEATTCSSGLSCSGSSCVCPTNTHRCTTGSAAGTCKANTDATACGNSCTDCTQSNAVAQCSSGNCNNTCRAGVSQLCAGSNGRPGCGSWDFEDGKQAWQIDIAYTGNVASPTESGNIGANGSTKSLAIPYNNLNDGGSGVLVRVALCGTVDLTGKTVSASIRMDTTDGSPAGNGYVTLYSGNTQAGGFTQITNYTEGSWFEFEHNLDSTFVLNPDATLAVTHVGLTLNVSAWSGTIYIDDFQISD